MRFRKGNFLEDLELGEEAEKMALQQLLAFYNFESDKVKLIHFNKDYKYDFALTNGFKYEVKYDRESFKSGNVYIEFQAFGKSSGISTTEANFYLIILPNIETDVLINTNFTFCLIDVDKLKYLIDKQLYKKCYCFLNGGYIFDKRTIINNSIVI